MPRCCCGSTVNQSEAYVCCASSLGSVDPAAGVARESGARPNTASSTTSSTSQEGTGILGRGPDTPGSGFEEVPHHALVGIPPSGSTTPGGEVDSLALYKEGRHPPRQRCWECVMGPDTHVLIGSIVLILIPGCVFVFYSSAHWIASIFGGLILATTLYFLIQTATIDPGFLPKQPPPPDNGIPQDRNRTQIITVRRRDGTLKNIHIERRWCYTCNLLRPPRASHCPYCNACVERMDHHCPWTGTCIGRRNYKYFVAFVWSVTIMCLYVGAICIYGLIKRQQDYIHQPTTSPGQFKESGAQSVVEGQREIHYFDMILLIYALVFLCMVGGLAIYHTHLVVHNLTTHEEMKSFYANEDESPFDQGSVCGNVREVCCWPAGDSLVCHLRWVGSVGANAAGFGPGNVEELQPHRRDRSQPHPVNYDHHDYQREPRSGDQVSFDHGTRDNIQPPARTERVPPSSFGAAPGNGTPSPAFQA